MNSRHLKKYRIPNKHRFRELYSFAMQYRDFKEELQSVSFLGSSQDGEVKGSTPGDPTGRIAIEQADLISKVNLIEQCARDADPTIWKSVLLAVTTPNITYNYLSQNRFLYCGRDKFYVARQKFYWLLDKRKP